MREIDLNEQEKYIAGLLPQETPLKSRSRKASEDLGLARISISPAEAQIVKVLLKLHGAKKCVEIGTLTGLSAQYFFEALPEGGELWTLEKDPKHAQKALNIFSELDQGNKKIHLIVGDAREELPRLEAQSPFDAVFIDGNKAAYLDYLLWAEKNLRKGGLVLADNIFLSGAVWGANTQQKFSEKQIRIMQEFNRRISDNSLYDSAIVPTFEGLFVAIKK